MQEDDHNDWYSAGAGNGEPHCGEQTSRSCYSEPFWSPEAEQKKKKSSQMSSKMKIVMLVLGVIVLIIASAYLFAAKGGTPGRIPSMEGPDAGLHLHQDLLLPDGDWENSLPPAETGTGVTLKLEPVPAGAPLSLQEIYARCLPSVVGIRTEIDQTHFSAGTGVIMTQDGYLITNTHVLDGGHAVTVTLSDGTEYSARLVGADTVSDIAVLKIEAAGLTAAVFGDSSGLVVGDAVATIGNPLGEELRGTMTNGIVSAINRDITHDGHMMTLLQTNAAINEGNSGGPLINMYGQVIGITNMKVASVNGVEGIGFAIPSTSLRTVVDAIIADGRVVGRPSIGITVGAVSSIAADYYDLPEGLYVESVAKGSDAEAKGIRSGDILQAVNGAPVTTTYDVNAAKQGLHVGDTLTLTFCRDGKTFDVIVTLMDTNDIY